MKTRITTSLVAALFAMTGFAQQTVLFDFEEATGDAGFWGDHTTKEVVDNPDGEGRCLKVTVPASGNNLGISGLNINLDGRRRISMMVKKTTSENVLFQLEGADGSYYQQVATWYQNDNQEEPGGWQKMIFDFKDNSIDENPTVIVIVPQTKIADEVVYIDNITIEDHSYVNGVKLSEVTDLTTTTSLTLTGAWMQGVCVNPGNGWSEVKYNDFEQLQNKLAGNTILTSVDMTGVTAQKDAYYIYKDINPNCLVYANQWAGDHNVIINGKAERVWLYDREFNCPAAFEALDITYTRDCYFDGGWETIALPFTTGFLKKVVGEEQVDMADSEYVFESYNGKDANYIYFTNAASIDANTPSIFRLTGGTAGNPDKQTVIFCASNQNIAATADVTFDGLFKATFSLLGGQSGHYLLNGAGDAFAPAADDAVILPFRAYLDVNVASGAPLRVSHSGNPTGINNENQASLTAYSHNGELYINAPQGQRIDLYSIDGVLIKQAFADGKTIVVGNLNKGLYLLNGRKVSVN